MNPPKVSLIVPVSNVERYLPKCISSILSQIYTDFELLLIDDGSTDGSGKLCDLYAQKDVRIKVFHKVNEGASKARNLGIKHATGEYIAFIDSDDWIESNYLDILIKESYNTDIIFFPARMLYEENSETIYIPKVINDKNRENVEDTILYLYKNNQKFQYFVFTWNKLFKKEIIEKNNIKFNETIVHKEDELFTLEYCRYINNIKTISTPIYNYRILPTSLTFQKHTSEELLIIAQNIQNETQFYSNSFLINYLHERSFLFQFIGLINCCKLKKRITIFNLLYNNYHKNKSFIKEKKLIVSLFRHNRIVSFIFFNVYYLLSKLKNNN